MSLPIDEVGQSAARVEHAIRRARRATYLTWTIAAVIPLGLLLLFVFDNDQQSLVPWPEMTRIPELPSLIVGKTTQISGVDKNKLPFAVTATRGVQDESDKHVVHLESVTGDFTRLTGNHLTVSANSGRYDSKGKLLDLKGSVVITEIERFVANMETAFYDEKKGELSSGSPVRVKMQQGVVEADSFISYDNGARILFRGKVKAHFDNPDSSAAGNTDVKGDG